MDIDKESGGLLSSLEKKEDSKTNEMTNYTNLLSRPTSTIGERYFSKSEITKLINTNPIKIKYNEFVVFILYLKM